MEFARTATQLLKDTAAHFRANEIGPRGAAAALGASAGGIGAGPASTRRGNGANNPSGTTSGSSDRNLEAEREAECVISKYKHDEVRLSLQEVGEHYQSLANILEAFREEGIEWESRPELASSVLIHHQALLRNKRLLMVYQNLRLERLSEYRWRCGRLPPAAQARLSPSEKEFCRAYDKLLGKYHRQVGLDLTVMAPPSETLIKVRVLEDLGVLEFDYLGEVEMMAGTVQMVPAEEAELLIREGKLEHV